MQAFIYLLDEGFCCNTVSMHELKRHIAPLLLLVVVNCSVQSCSQIQLTALVADQSATCA